MFYYLRGKITVLEPYLAVVDCSGVGFACNTSMRTLSTLKVGQEATLYTYCNIREDAFDIYGFATTAEINSFRMLMGVSGVGPKAALSILSGSSPEDLALAIVGGNEKVLTMAPGVGKKLAQRIILELKDKISKELSDPQLSGFVPGETAVQSGGKAKDVAAALSVLGYSPQEISAAMRKVDISALTVEDAIREVLKTSLK
jgi:Holliday junction DNA helicase RuvA